MSEVFLLAFARTQTGRLGGVLSAVSAVQPAAACLHAPLPQTLPNKIMRRVLRTQLEASGS